LNEIRNKLPADPGAMILGIIALLISLVGCCCGILAIPAVIMSIIGLVWASKSITVYNAAPESYHQRSFSSVKSAKVVNIIALVLSVLGFLIALFVFGSLIANPENIFEQLENGKFSRGMNDAADDTTNDEEIDTWHYEEATDSTQTNERPVEVKEMTDSIPR
jgi:hypothetical protein